MKTMKWLLRREYWEHRGSLFTTPLVIAAVMLLLALASLAHGAMGGDGETTIRFTHATASFEGKGMTAAQQELALNAAANMYMLLGAPIYLLMGFSLTLFCMNSLFDERKDRSILFWKSLPVSDRDTVLSKAVMAALVAPLFSLVLAGLTSFLMLVIFCTGGAIHGVPLFSLVFSKLDFVLAPFRLVALLPVYTLWALPTIAWLMLVSSWARSKVLGWAIGVPLLLGILLTWADKAIGLPLDTGWYWHHVASRVLLGLVPGLWIKFAGLESSALLSADHHVPDLGHFVSASWSTLAEPGLWIGVAAAGVMLYGAIRLRGARDEG